MRPPQRFHTCTMSSSTGKRSHTTGARFNTSFFLKLSDWQPICTWGRQETGWVIWNGVLQSITKWLRSGWNGRNIFCLPSNFCPQGVGETQYLSSYQGTGTDQCWSILHDLPYTTTIQYSILKYKNTNISSSIIFDEQNSLTERASLSEN